MVLVLLILTYNLAKTNLTFIGMRHYPGANNTSTPYWGIQFHQPVGSINILQNMLNFYYINTNGCQNIAGDIQTTFANTSKINYIEFEYIEYDQNGYFDGSRTSTNIYGNISIFGDKYDLAWIIIARYPNITGEAKSLKNLKKLYSFNFSQSGCTGSKTDLWNDGDNIRYFYI